MDGLSARYRRALEERAALQRTLVASIRQNGGQTLDDDSLLFVAQWVDRRLRADPQALASVQASAGVLRDLARRSAQAGTGTPFQPQSPAQGAVPNGAGNAAPNAPQNGGHVQTSPQLTPPQGHAAPALPAENAHGGAERAPAPRVGGQQ